MLASGTGPDGTALPSAPPSGAAGGDLTGTYPNPTIKASVGLTGNPTAPTQAATDNSTRIASTAYVTNGINNALPRFTIPIIGSANVAFTTGWNAIPNSWTAFNPNAYPPTPPGKTLQVRLRATYTNVGLGTDVLGIRTHDTTTVPAFTQTANASGGTSGELITPWANMPGALVVIYIEIENTSEATGSVNCCYAEVGYN